LRDKLIVESMVMSGERGLLPRNTKEFSMANINMTFQDLRDQASRLDSGRQAILEQLAQLRSQVEELIASGFVTDQASGAFGDSYSQFTNGANETISGLEGMTQFLNLSADRMQELDSQLATAIRV